MTPPRDHRGHQGRKRTGHVRTVKDRIGKMEQQRGAVPTPTNITVAAPQTWDELIDVIAQMAFDGNHLDGKFSTIVPMSEDDFSHENAVFLELTDGYLESLAHVFKTWVMATVAAQSAAAGVPVGALQITTTVRLMGPA